MDNLVNSLVGNVATTAGNTNEGTVKDYQGKTYDRNQLLSLSKQVAGSIDANAIKGGVFSTKGESVGFNYDEATKLLGHPPTAAEQVILDMSRHILNEGYTDLNQVDASTTNRRFGSTYTGGGGTIYEIKRGADGKPVISSWSKDTSDKKAIIGGLAIAATLFGIPGVTEGLLSSAPAGSTLATVGADAAANTAFELANAGYGAFEGGTALNTLAGTGAGSAFEAMNAGATAMTDLGASELANAGATALSDLGASELANAGASANTASNVANAANTANTAANAVNTANAAKTGALGLTTADALALQAGGTLLSGAINQNAIGNASDIINEAGVKGSKTLSDVYADQKGLNTATNATLKTNYQDLVTNLNNAGNAQIAAYEKANEGIKANAGTQLGLLANTYQGQKDQAAANASGLNANYNTTLGNMGNVYNQQVGFQQPYQDVGRAGSQGLIDNQGYLTRQFGASDLNEQLAPNYAFQLQQGQMANQRAANMGGGSLGGNALRGLQDYTQNYAAGAYQNAFNNFNTQRQNIYSTLAGMANIGTTSGGQLASLGNTYGSNMGSLSSNLGGNLTTNTGNLINAGNAYGTNTSGVTNSLNNVLSSNLGQLQGAYNQYGSNLTNATNTYGGNVVNSAGQVINAGNVYGTNQTGLTTALAAANAQNQVAGANVVGTTLGNLGNTALLSSLIKAT
jgi:hypothetical protein